MSLPFQFIRNYQRSISAFCFLISFLAAPLYAGLLDWTRIGPEGGLVRAIWDFQAPPGVSFVTAGGGSLWKTTDGGNSWHESSTGLPRGGVRLAGSRSDSQFFYALSNGLYKTLNGGNSWKQITSLPSDSAGRSSVALMAVHPDNPATAYVLVSYEVHEIWVTEDRGESWRSLPIPEEYFAGRSIGRLSIDPGEPHSLYVQISNWQSSTTIKSDDGGTTWSPITGGIPFVWVDDTTGKTVRVDPATIVLPLNSKDFGTPFFVDPFHLRRVYHLAIAESELRLHVSDDAGDHWSWKTVPNDVNGVIISGSDLLYLTTNAHGVLRSTDGGATLSPANTGLISSDIRSVHAFTDLPNLVYIRTGAGIYRSEDRGASWQFLGENAAYSVAVDPTNSLIQFGWKGDQPVRTTDGGKTWVATDLPAAFDYRYSPSASGTVYAIAGLRGYKSTNHGATWRELSNIPEPGVVRLAVSPTNPDILFVATVHGDYPVGYTGFHRSTDGGETWKTLDDSLPSVVAVGGGNSPAVLRSSSSLEMEKSTDLGETWTRNSLTLNDLHLSSMVVDPLNVNRIFALDKDGTGYETTNGGLSWRQVGPKGSAANSVYSNPLQAVFRPTRTQLYFWDEGSVFTLEAPVTRDRYFPHLADGLEAEDQISTSLAFVNTGADCDLDLYFLDDNGDPMVVSLAGIGQAADFHLRLKAGASLRTETSGQGALRTGYLRWRGGPRVTGSALFKYWRAGEAQYQVEVPEALPATRSSVLVRNDSNYEVGLALLNPGNTSSHVNLDLYDRFYSLIESRSVELRPGWRISQYASELFASLKTLEEGLIVVRSTQPLLGLSLLEYNEISDKSGRLQTRISALPVIPDDPDVRGYRDSIIGKRRLLFPQFADGVVGSDQMRSEIQLINMGQSLGFVQATVTISFRDSLNRPIEVELAGLGRGATFSFALPGGHVRTLLTRGSGPLKVGYVSIEGSTHLAGVLTCGANRDGEVLYRVGIEPPPFMQRFSFPFLSGSDETAALAMWSDDYDDSYPTVYLFDETGKLVETKSMANVDPEFTGSGQTAKYATEYFERVAGGQVTSGLISIESESVIAALGLRQWSLTDLANELRLMLTSLPVAPGIPGLE